MHFSPKKIVSAAVLSAALVAVFAAPADAAVPHSIPIGDGGGSCTSGASVGYGSWQTIGGTPTRTIYWEYVNCGSSTVKKGININLFRDPCITISGYSYATYDWDEYQYSIEEGQYDGTYNC